MAEITEKDYLKFISAMDKDELTIHLASRLNEGEKSFIQIDGRLNSIEKNIEKIADYLDPESSFKRFKANFTKQNIDNFKKASSIGDNVRKIAWPIVWTATLIFGLVR